MVSQESCQSIFRGVDARITENMICAAASRTDACQVCNAIIIFILTGEFKTKFRQNCISQN